MTRQLRKDAAHRRAALLEAAAAIFASEGIEAPLEMIADRAGVGRGTLYRNFADRTELALAVLIREVDALGARFVGDDADDPRAFFGFVDDLAELLLRNAAVAGAIRGVSSNAVLAPLRARIVAAGERPLRAAQTAGLIRRDVGPDDLRLIAMMLGAGLQNGEAADRTAASQKVRRIVLDGLRAPA